MRARRSSSYSDKGASGMPARLRDAGFLAAGLESQVSCEFGPTSTASQHLEPGRSSRAREVFWESLTVWGGSRPRRVPARRATGESTGALVKSQGCELLGAARRSRRHRARVHVSITV